MTDLDLLTALGHNAAVAIERARLNQKIVAEEKKRERLGRFLSPQVTNRIINSTESQGPELGLPETKDASVLFADIVGFTSMSEKMSPAAVSYLLNDYLSRMTEIIFKYDGTLDKYIGDAIMAVFGAPLDMPDHAERAIRTALEMRERLEEFNAERREGPQLRIRIGINSGKVVAGEIGSVNKKEYTVLGRHGEHGEPPGELRGQADDGGGGREHLSGLQGVLRVAQPGRHGPERQGEDGRGLRGGARAWTSLDLTPPGAATGGA